MQRKGRVLRRHLTVCWGPLYIEEAMRDSLVEEVPGKLCPIEGSLSKTRRMGFKHSSQKPEGKMIWNI